MPPQVVGGSAPAAFTVGVAVVATGRATAVVPVVVGAVDGVSAVIIAVIVVVIADVDGSCDGVLRASPSATRMVSQKFA